MFKKYLSKLANPLLFYINKSGNTVFRNFCLLKNDGMLYEEIIQIKDAGKVLEYRIELEKKLNTFAIVLALVLYITVIHTKFTLLFLFFAVILWILLYNVGRIICTEKYSKKLYDKFGVYKLTEFRPKLNDERKDLYTKNFRSKIIIYVLILSLIITPAFILLKGISVLANQKTPHIRVINCLTGIYSTLYPKTPLIYDINAVSKYKNGDFIGATADYIKIFKMTGKKFDDKDLKRFANLLYLVRKSNGARDAIDIFNEYSTTKKMTKEQELKMLWIKSIFSIASQIPDFVTQDYDDMLTSLDENDKRTEFYTLADKAYMLYLLKDFSGAIKIYNNLIPFAENDKKNYGSELKSLYLERGFSKLEFGDKKGADEDFVSSKVDINKIGIYEPVIRQPEFIIGDF